MNNYNPEFMTEYNLLRDVEDLLEEKQKKRKKKTNTLLSIMGLIQVPFLALTIVDLDYIGLWVIILLVSFVITLIFFLVFKQQVKNQVLYNVIYPRAVRLFNQEHDLTFAFQFKPKIDKTFNSEMGLFTRYASVSCTYQMNAQLDTGNPITVQACRLVTSNGKSSTLHFDGIYLVLPISGIPTQQLRTSGKPKRKDMKFDRVEDYPDNRLYLQKGQISSGPHPYLLQVFEELPDLFDLKHYYVGSNEKEVHVALWMRHKPSMPKEINTEELDKIVQPLHKVMQYSISVLERYNDVY